LTKEVLPYLLERARDADASTRKALYGRLLPALGDFRHLSLTHREKLLRWGLRDRDENVRKATARLFCERWIEDCAKLPAAQAEDEDGEASKDEKQAAVPSLDALLELLERIDVVNSGGEGGIALIAMQEFWQGRPDYLDYVSFPPTFWDELTPELAFVARTFNDYCRTSTEHVGPRPLVELAEDRLPEVSEFGRWLEIEIKKLIQATINDATDEEAYGDDEELAHSEFIVEQMLHMALTFDYSDEVGRRKMYSLMREALAMADLPEEVTRLAVSVLRLVCGDTAKGERDFCGVVLEAIAEVHDTIMGEEQDGAESESFHSAASQVGNEDDNIELAQKKAKQQEEDPEAAEEKAVRELMVNMKCLHIALCMLQNVQCDLEENIHLVTMLNNLVVPAVRSQEAPIRERGLLCLGLCCLLGRVRPPPLLCYHRHYKH
jgi:condensin complex subunit 3